MAATRQFMHAFHGDAAQRQVFGKLPVVDFERGQVLAQPRTEYVHRESSESAM